jgi:hypothetical protein
MVSACGFQQRDRFGDGTALFETVIARNAVTHRTQSSRQRRF